MQTELPIHRFGAALAARMPVFSEPDMVDAVASSPPPGLVLGPIAARGTADAPRTDAAAETLSFGSVLSALNPLQYLPVVGTIYRATTGDEVAEPVRRIGSAVGSFLLGGPVGLAVNLATLLAEKVSGIDLDRTGQALIASVAGGSSATADPEEAAAAASEAALTEADVLNARELQRIHAAHAAYVATVRLTPSASAGLG